MLRFALITALVLVLAPASPAAAAGPASVSLTACTPKERTASFEARMEQVPGAERMQLRYSLEARKRGRGRGWRRVAAPELAGWRTAATETTRFISERNMTKLVGPSYYRAYVRFRWIDEDGHTVARARSRSRACWQPDHRPNVKLRELSFNRKGSYVVLVANSGRSPTGAFDVSVTGLAPLVVAGLAPGEQRLLEAAGPACQPGTQVTATADPLDLIDERNERDNAVTRRCPLARASR